MQKSTRHTYFSAQASLAAVCSHLHRLDILAPIREQVQIAQKTVRYTPFDKLRAALLLLLTGAGRLVEINTRLRPQAALLAAFGQQTCAEQSVVQDTLNACTQENVHQMQQALDTIFRQHSRAFAHDYQTDWQLLDIDLSGLPCGKQAEGATKGYFANQKNRRGRQEGRVYASRYEEIVCVRLYPGNTPTATAFWPLVEAAQETLQLSAAQRTRTLIRVDAGGGSLDDVNACLQAGYQVHCKDYSDQRVQRLLASVSAWYDDPRVPGRQVGLVSAAPSAYARPLVRVAVRSRKKNGQWGADVILSSLSGPDMLRLSGFDPEQAADAAAVLLAYVYFYDARGGGIEGAFKQDKQVLGLTRRNKKRFAAQEVLVCLSALAHNLLVWAKGWLQTPCLDGYGLRRLLRDGLSISGQLVFEQHRGLRRLVLNVAHPLASPMSRALRKLLAQQHIDVYLGQI